MNLTMVRISIEDKDIVKILIYITFLIHSISGELLSDDIIKTALFTFEEHGIIYCSVDANTKVRKIGITPKYDFVEQIQEVTDNILRYVTF